MVAYKLRFQESGSRLWWKIETAKSFRKPRAKFRDRLRPIHGGNLPFLHQRGIASAGFLNIQTFGGNSKQLFPVPAAQQECSPQPRRSATIR